METVKPYNERGKKEEVEQMFDNIAHSYDFLNHFFSLGIDVLWRKKAIRILRAEQPKQIMDVATGTGDFALEAARMIPDLQRIVGVDLSEGMLSRGREKIAKRGLTSLIEMVKGDSEHLPFADHTFDAFTVAFGVRNFENLEAGLKDMLRVLKPGAPGIVLEFSRPEKFPVKQLFRFYFRFVMPTVGKWVSKDSRAYTYLPESVDRFPSGEEFLEVMRRAGYKEVRRISLSGGIASIYVGRK